MTQMTCAIRHTDTNEMIEDDDDSDNRIFHDTGTWSDSEDDNEAEQDIFVTGTLTTGSCI
jgi:hypothetical protein